MTKRRRRIIKPSNSGKRLRIVRVKFLGQNTLWVKKTTLKDKRRREMNDYDT